MVHIPVFGVDVAEPRILHLLPQFVEVLVRACARLADAAYNAVHPVSDENRDRLAQMEIDAMPREFDRLFKRTREGELENEDQISSEAEEAGYAYYRRMLRTSVMGATDEGEDGVLLRKMGRHGPSPRELVLQEYYQAHPDMVPSLDRKAELLELPMEPAMDGQGPGAAGARGEGEAGAERDPEGALQQRRWRDEELQGLRAKLAAINSVPARRRAEARQQAEDLARLQARARSPLSQATRTVARAGLGVGLGVGVVKGLGLGLRQVVRAIQARRRKARAARGGREGRPRAPPPSAPRQPPQQPQAGRARQGQVQQQPQPQEKQQQEKQQQQAAPRAARPTTRTR